MEAETAEADLEAALEAVAMAAVPEEASAVASEEAITEDLEDPRVGDITTADLFGEDFGDREDIITAEADALADFLG